MGNSPPNMAKQAICLERNARIKNRFQSRRDFNLDDFMGFKLEGQPLALSARNMGKNDLWIAATASILALELLTADNDFNHLDPIFLNLIKV
ncbi:MAG: hypothetical protein RL329_1750 [Bacteroidota bacterium]